MKIDAHYYGILAFARAIGFKKEYAHTIAYASQFVDDAKINQIVLKSSPENLEFEIISGEPSFFNMATCHSYFKINTFNYEAMTNNTIAFHFVPGCKGENFAKKLRCSEESPIILNILKELEQDNDLIKLGITLHAYADTFSHQGFSGLISKVNDIKDCHSCSSNKYNRLRESLIIFLKKLFKVKFDKYLDKLNPAYGHAQVFTYPDTPYLKWQYKYDYSDEFCEKYKETIIDNKIRFIEAFKSIHNYLNNYLNNNPEYRDNSVNFKDYEVLFNALIKESTTKKRIKNWKKILIEEELINKNDIDILTYNKELWLKEAFKNYQSEKFNNRKVSDVEINNNFENSNWYKYYKAVKWYKEQFHKYSKEHLLEIPR